MLRREQMVRIIDEVDEWKSRRRRGAWRRGGEGGGGREGSGESAGG